MTKIQEAKKIIEEGDKVVIGAGAGLSAAAGLTYSGSRFQFFFKRLYYSLWHAGHVFCSFLSF